VTDPTLAYTLVRCAAGHRHRRFMRRSEADPSVRLPEEQRQRRRRLGDRCAAQLACPWATTPGSKRRAT
jgi:hypothetical protein